MDSMNPSQPAPAARLLIVDDEQAEMEALCNTLRDHGYATTGFSSARQALAALQRGDFDLLLTGLMMPEMDGIDLLRAAAAKDADLVGVVMTGHGTIDTAVQAMKAGALDYILKPFKLSVVLPVLARSLGIRRLRLENAELERLVRKRTGELEIVNREFEAFSYSVAHDLRAPLRSINGFSQILLESHAAQLDPEGLTNLAYIRESAQHMGQIIEGLLSLARVSRAKIQRAAVSLSALAEIRIERLRLSHPQRQVEAVIAPDLAADCDEGLVGLVLDNLLDNAWKFTGKRSQGRIEVGRLGDAKTPTFFVRDNGAGFNPDYAHKLFGVFQRLHAQSDFAGTGIGLATVQRIVQRHDGRIWAAAKIGEGATFYFTLQDDDQAPGKA